MPRLVSKAITTRTLRLSGYEKEELPSRLSEIVHHPLSPFTKRAFYAIVVLAIVMAVGTVGLMVIEGWGLVASFYFMALLATAEGPAATPATDVGKIICRYHGLLLNRSRNLSHNFHVRPVVWVRSQGRGALF